MFLLWQYQVIMEFFFFKSFSMEFPEAEGEDGKRKQIRLTAANNQRQLVFICFRIKLE